ncbi:MAG: efflux RND transporter permease subunit, partial [Bdellovibrionales bacterium]|nr:efflux RND transporter permease subunit [Bdellovibrionales bacterium]
VISENYARLRDEGLSQLDAAVQAVHQFWLPITATAFTTIAAFVPMLVTKGVMGEFIKWIPIVVTFTLVVCLFESFILLPARLRFTIRDKTLNKKTKSKKPKFQWFQWIQNKFEGFMNFSLRHRYIVSVFITMIMIFSFVLAKYGNRFELFPKENTEFYIARFEAPIETPLARTKKVAQDLAKQSYKLLGDTNVKYIISRSGVQQMGGNDPQAKNGDYVGMLIIVVPPDRARELETEWVLDKLRTIKDDRLTNLSFEAQRNGPPVGYPITITFRSSNYQKMRELINKMKDKFRQVDGVLDINDDEIVGGPEYNIQINEEQLSSLNLSTQAVGMALRTALQGSIASELSLNNKEFDLRIRYDEKDRETVSALKNTTVLTNSGTGARLIPIFNIANIEQVSGPSVRKRFDFQRAITLTGSVVPEKITSVQANQMASQWLKTDFKDYASEVTWKFGGEEENTKESVQSLFQALVLAFLGIFVILIFLFRSYSVPFLILSSIPLGLVGVFSAFFLHQKPLSFFALIGILGLAGVVVNAAIVLVSYIEELKMTTSLNLKQVLAKASADRLRAVLITSLTTVGGLMPTAYGIGGSDPILVPMTLAMAWGLVSGTLLTLIWIPCGYMILEDIFSSKLLNRFTGSMTEPMVDNNEGA